jgi:hypothetical protein
VDQLEFVVCGDVGTALRQLSKLRQVLRIELDERIAHRSDGVPLKLHVSDAGLGNVRSAAFSVIASRSIATCQRSWTPWPTPAAPLSSTPIRTASTCLRFGSQPHGPEVYRSSSPSTRTQRRASVSYVMVSPWRDEVE